MKKRALVIHPSFSTYGGGEMVCLHVIRALQNSDYSVLVATDHFSPDEVQEKFGLGEILAKCEHIALPPFKPIFPRFLAYQRLSYNSRLMKGLERLKPDIAFNTQGPTPFLRNTMNFSMIFDMFQFFALHASRQMSSTLKSTMGLPYHALVGRKLTAFASHRSSNRVFIPLSSYLEYQLELYEYPHTPTIFPPCDLVFKPREKQKRVVQVTRLVPIKRIEDFILVAKQLPDYPFVIVGGDSLTEGSADATYRSKLLADKPQNVSYIEARIIHRPDLVEESKVYLYTSIEPGINISAAQALGAGCIPVTPTWGGGAEIIRASGAGFTYTDIEDATKKVKSALEMSYSPEQLATKATIFSADKFEESIARISSM